MTTKYNDHKGQDHNNTKEKYLAHGLYEPHGSVDCEKRDDGCDYENQPVNFHYPERHTYGDEVSKNPPANGPHPFQQHWKWTFRPQDSRGYQAKQRCNKTTRYALLTGLAVLAASAMLGAAAAHAQTRLVSGAGGTDFLIPKLGANDCTTIPCATLTHAIAVASIGDNVQLSNGPFSICNVNINKSITIAGAGANRMTLDAGNSCRHFDISPNFAATVTLSNLDLIHGQNATGGSILVNPLGDLTISNSRLAYNNATSGGAIANLGHTVVKLGSLLENNGAAFEGGAVVNQGGAFESKNSEYVWNTASMGGAISSSDGTIDLDGDTLSGNIAKGNGGAIDASSSTLDIQAVTFFNNQAEIGFGGAINNTESSDLTLTESDVIYNLAGGSGGGVSIDAATATLVKSTFSVNQADFDGGAVSNENGGTLTSRDTSMSGNSAGRNGGAIADATGTWTSTMIRRNTLERNSAVDGGGIHYVGAAGGKLFVLNSTFSANSADRGGAIFDTGSGSMAMANTTSYGQVISFNGGTLFSDSSIPLEFDNSIIAMTNNAAGGGPAPDCAISVGGIVGRHNRSDTCYPLGAPAAFNLGAVTQLDATLKNNGGETYTHRLLAGSNAIDQGYGGCINPDTSQPLPYDQRNESRPIDGNGDGNSICDIGAYEYAPLIAVPNFNGPPTTAIVVP
jgi:hypothetical protein